MTARLVLLGCVAGLMVLSLSGCATISRATISDADLAREAGRALNRPASEFTITDRDHSAFYTYFTATGRDGVAHRCKIDAGGLGLGTWASNGANCDENLERNPFLGR